MSQFPNDYECASRDHPKCFVISINPSNQMETIQFPLTNRNNSNILAEKCRWNIFQRARNHRKTFAENRKVKLGSRFDCNLVGSVACDAVIIVKWIPFHFYELLDRLTTTTTKTTRISSKRCDARKRFRWHDDIERPLSVCHVVLQRIESPNSGYLRIFCPKGCYHGNWQRLIFQSHRMRNSIVRR